MAWDDVVVDGTTIAYAADHNEEINQIKAKIAKTTNITALNETGIADGEIAVFNLTNKDIRTSNVTISTSVGADNTTVPTGLAVSTAVAAKAAVADLTGTAETLGGSAVVGTAVTAARSDHKHAITNPALDTLAACTDITTRNASTSAHGLVVKVTAPASGYLNVVGVANAETAYACKALFDANAPATETVGDSAVVGTAMVAARRDHRHAVASIYSDVDSPKPLGDADWGVSNYASRMDHVHPYDTTTLDLALTRSLTGATMKRSVNTSGLYICGGTGTTGQGAYIIPYGNEHTYAGQIRFATPNAAKTSVNLVMLITGVTSTPYLDLQSHQIKTVADPTDAQDVATKAYVDDLMTGHTYTAVHATSTDSTLINAPGANKAILVHSVQSTTNSGTAVLTLTATIGGGSVIIYKTIGSSSATNLVGSAVLDITCDENTALALAVTSTAEVTVSYCIVDV